MKKVAFICFDNFQSLDLSGPMAVFAQAKHAEKPLYSLYILSLTGGCVRASSGLEVQIQHLTPINQLDTLVVIGGNCAYRAIEDKTLIRFVIKQSAAARRVVSICSGSFILAEASLLEGKRATTLWQAMDKFALRYPEVKVEPDAIFVSEGKITSSVGITAGMDLSFSLVEENFGRDLAMSIARMLVIYYRLSEGQTQFSEPLKAQRLNNKLGFLCEQIQQTSSDDLSVPILTQKLTMSERNFSRCFTQEIGMSPGKYA